MVNPPDTTQYKNSLSFCRIISNPQPSSVENHVCVVDSILCTIVHIVRKLVNIADAYVPSVAIFVGLLSQICMVLSCD